MKTTFTGSAWPLRQDLREACRMVQTLLSLYAHVFPDPHREIRYGTPTGHEGVPMAGLSMQHV